MADWKLPMSYSYNPSYHAYAYGLVYPPGPDQGAAGLGWAEAAFNHGGGYYAASSPKSPGDGETNPGDIRGPVLCFADTQGQRGRFFFPPSSGQPEQPGKEGQGARGDAASDSEAHTPDSWSSASSSDGCVPKAPATSWVERSPQEYQDSGSPDSSEPVSSSLNIDEPTGFGSSLEEHGPPCTPSPAAQETTTQPKKAKARTAFSEGQMSALTHRFNMQRYLTPVEMKTLAGLTGLTYKQVKTWFQNRRMKLKRHQKENGWASERFPNTGYTGIPHHSQFMPDHYSVAPFREATFSRSPPQSSGYYSGYPQPATPPKPPARVPGNWSLPPTGHFEQGSAGYGGIANCGGDDGAGVIDSPTGVVMVQNTTQWAT
ncbi:homeobox protein NANOG [Brienomyrus brachyistius]|uniref:homeobox protein NANOG n=1 Tax=Brienomyrus brachyistius TaxID=42636 RepID=UPI0020B22E95|nr:homeobox protein NANOG [Brienomyrus brachyistius]